MDGRRHSIEHRGEVIGGRILTFFGTYVLSCFSCSMVRKVGATVPLHPLWIHPCIDSCWMKSNTHLNRSVPGRVYTLGRKDAALHAGIGNA